MRLMFKPNLISEMLHFTLHNIFANKDVRYFLLDDALRDASAVSVTVVDYIFFLNLYHSEPHHKTVLYQNI